MSKIIIKSILVYFILVYISADDVDAEIEITSNTMEWKREENVAIAVGNAKAVQNNRVLIADKIVVFFTENRDKEEIYKLDASGNVKFKKEDQVATGESATYLIKNERIIIKGNVKLEKDNSIMLGEELSIDLKNSSSKLISNKDSGKVKVKYNTEKVNNEKN